MLVLVTSKLPILMQQQNDFLLSKKIALKLKALYLSFYYRQVTCRNLYFSDLQKNTVKMKERNTNRKHGKNSCCYEIESQNHKNILIRRDLKSHLVQLLCNEQRHLQLDQVAQSPTLPNAVCLQGQGIQCISGQPAPALRYPHYEKMTSRIILSSFFFFF